MFTNPRCLQNACSLPYEKLTYNAHARKSTKIRNKVDTIIVNLNRFYTKKINKLILISVLRITIVSIIISGL